MAATAEAAAAEAAAAEAAAAEAVSRELSRVYYKNYFPAKGLHEWLSRAWIKQEHAENREYSIVERTPRETFYRYQSCPSADALHALVCRHRTAKVDAGPVYNASPQYRKKLSTFACVGRELVFDIDLDDYGGVAASDLEACDSLWRLVVLGLEVVRSALMNEYGYKHVLLVYSGRRGGHLWVCDERAFVLTDEQRSAIVGSLQNGAEPWLSAKVRRTFTWAASHPNLKRHVKSLQKAFSGVGVKRRADGGLGLLDTEAQRRSFYAMVHSSAIPELLRDVASDSGRRFLERMEQSCRQGDWLRERLLDAKLALLWPRLDINVTRSSTHLLKVPFSLHPKTGRVSMPIFCDPMKWSPRSDCPTVQQLSSSHTGVDLFRCNMANAVGQLEAFTARMRGSESERGRCLAPAFVVLQDGKRSGGDTALQDAKRRRPTNAAAIVNFCSPKARPLHLPCIVPHARICWRLRRTLTAWSEDHGQGRATRAFLDVEITKSNHNAVCLIQPNQHPPHEGCDSTTLDTKLNRAMGAIITVFDNPGTRETVATKNFILIVDYKTVSDAGDEFDKAAKSLSTPDTVLELRREWGETAMRATLKMKLGWMMETELQTML